MNPEVLILALCDAAFIDPAGKVTLYGLFDIMYANSFPTRHPQFTIFCKALFAGPTEARLTIEDPRGKVIFSPPPFRVEQAGSGQVLFNVVNFEFPVEGEYRLTLVGPSGPAGSTRFQVRTKQ